jgi:hypothetical protein
MERMREDINDQRIVNGTPSSIEWGEPIDTININDLRLDEDGLDNLEGFEEDDR